MSTWYFPSWNGDVRIASHPDDDQKTLITIIEPTVDELRVLGSLAKLFGEKGWLKNRKTIWNPRGKKDRQDTVIHAPILEIGLYMLAHLKPGFATLTALKLESGEVKAKATGEEGFMAWLNNLFGGTEEKVTSTKELADALENAESDVEEKTSPHRRAHVAEEEKKPEKVDKAESKPKKPEKVDKAASVKRPTPSCPQCLPGSVEPANEVLQAFLDQEQHELWAKERAIVVRGGITGHRYLVSHRHGRHAAKAGKICFDLDDCGVLHFHDNSVPPEEEVLAAKLVLEHEEPWLRNEATCLSGNFDFVFKNPFGGFQDGVADSILTGEAGTFWRTFLLTFKGGEFALPEDRHLVKDAVEGFGRLSKELGIT